MLEGMSIFKGKLIILLHRFPLPPQPPRIASLAGDPLGGAQKNLNKLCSLACADKKTNNFSNSLVPKRVHSGSVIFYPTCSKPKDKVKVAVGSADLVV
jgi:hypothetical protein